jgi:hypothetical protein
MRTRCGPSLALLFLVLAACSGGTTVSNNGSSASGAPAPTVSMSVSPDTTAPGGSALLTWSSTGATSCSASGAWSGAKATSGSETINSIMGTSQYSLTCTGSGGSTTRTMTVTVTGGTGTGAGGAVDSSLVNRHEDTLNLAYAFAGFNTTTGSPVSSAPVVQDSGACTYRYSLASLPNGNYTIALSNDGGSTFKRSANVTVSGAVATQDFGPSRVLQVGPTRSFTDPSQVAGSVQDGDVVEIDAGVYNNTETVWPSNVNTLVLRGVGGRAHLIAPATISNQKAIWATEGTNTLVENIEFSGAAVPDLNGAGIRADGPDLAICGSYFHDNQEGILGGSGNTLIEYSEFANNGNCIDETVGCAHNMYIIGKRFTLRYSYSHLASQGHLVKSRASENRILYNRITAESGDSSYGIDLPNGGLSYIIGNLIEQGPNTSNSMIAYGEEGLSNPIKNLYVVNNTLVNDRSGGIFLDISGGTSVSGVVQNNLVVGPGTFVSGGALTQTTNVSTSTPNFVDRASYNYRPTSTTPGINQGAAPGVGSSFALTPVYQYVHPTNREPRPTDSAIDIGAYEFVGP